MRTVIRPGRAWGEVAAPPSKSYAHRMMICAALADGVSILHGITGSEDMRATLDCITALGAHCSLDGECLTVRGIGGKLPETAVFPCRESGSTLRFFLPLLPAGGGCATLTGTERLMARGIGVYETLFAEKQVSVEKTPTSVKVCGALSPGDYTLRGDVSSQFVTGLFFALPLLSGESRVHILPPVESRPYIDITLQVLARYGVYITETAPNTFTIPAGCAFHAADATVEGDWSNAAALLAFNALGGDVRVKGLSPDSLQGDRASGAFFTRLRSPGAEIDISACPDLGPVLFAVAAANHGALFTGTRRLRIKESDRAEAMAKELARFGTEVKVGENTVAVSPGIHAPDGILCSHNDHRIVMALSLLLSRTGGVIDGTEAIRKSYPGFFDTLARLHLEVHHETE